MDKVNSAPDGYSIRISQAPRDAAWDDFVVGCPGGHHEQTSLWGQVKGHYGWETLRIIVFKGKRIAGGAQVLLRRIGRWGRIGYVTRGPLVRGEDPFLLRLVVEQLRLLAAQDRLIFLVVVPPYPGHHYAPLFQDMGFQRKPELLPPSSLMGATLLLDLSQDLERLLAQMRKKTRQHLKRAQRAGVVVREGGQGDVETFRKLMWDLCRRRGTSPSPPQADFFRNLWDVFHPFGFVRLFLAEIKGKPVSALLVFPFGDSVRAWKIGWAGDHGEQSPNEVLYWEAIQWSQRQGYRFFDFVWIENRLAQDLSKGNPIDWTAVDGMSFFKTGFGGIPLLIPEPFFISYHPLLRILMSIGKGRFMGSRALTRLAGIIWKGSSQPGEG